MCQKYTSEHLKYQNFSGGACPQTPLGLGRYQPTPLPIYQLLYVPYHIAPPFKIVYVRP